MASAIGVFRFTTSGEVPPADEVISFCWTVAIGRSVQVILIFLCVPS